MKKTFKCAVLTATMMFAGSLLFNVEAQSPNMAQQKVIRLKLKKNTNGVVTYIDTTITVTEDFDEKKFLQSHGFQSDDLPAIDAGGKKIVVENIDIEGDSLTLDKPLNDSNHFFNKQIEIQNDSLHFKSGNGEVVRIKLDTKAEPGTQVYEYRYTSPDGQEVMIKKVKVVITNLNGEEQDKLGPITSVKENPSELNTSGLSFFPNPGNGNFTLQFTLKDKGNTTVRIFDVTGRSIYEEKLPSFSGTYEKIINISEKGKGTYFIQVTQDNKSVVRKVIVE